MHGLVIGKFLPFHRGHEHLIAAAAERCDAVTVAVCDAAWHPISASLRRAWIAESFPAATVVIVDQDEAGLTDDDSEGWAALTIAMLGQAPDLVFSSEDYGPVYAAHMGAGHVLVDRERIAVPASGTAIRENPSAHLALLPAHVRAHLIPRVCVLGAESTGKSTLAEGLARALGAPLVREFGRHYTEALPDPRRHRWTREDFRVIARTQDRFEDDAARWGSPVLVCDTNSFVTAVFSEAYLGEPDRILEAAARARHYDLFLVCDIDTPFQQDATGLRQGGERRRWMHDRYLEYVADQGAPAVAVSGSPTERLETALEAIDAVRAGGLASGAARAG